MTVACVAGHLGARQRHSWPACALWAWLAFLVGAALIASVLASQGTLDAAWHAAFTFNARYSRAGDWLGALRDWPRAMDALEPIGFAVWLALLGLVALLFGRRMARFPRALAIGLLVWFLAEVLFALVGPSRSLRYWQAVWPPVLMLAACAARHLQITFRRLRGGFRAGFALTTATLLLLLLAPTWRHYAYGLSSSYLEFTGPDRERDRLRREASLVKQVVPESEPIYVLSYDSGVYVYAQHACACRFTYPRSREQVIETLDVLEAGRAAAILIPEGPPNLPSECMTEDALARVRAVVEGYDSQGLLDGPARYTIYTCRSAQRAPQTSPANP